jgi:DNA polymerase (family 10)
METVGDLDILVTATANSPVMDRFTGYEDVTETVSSGKTRSTVILRSGLHVDLRVVPQVSYGAALCYFTGSRAHNIALRKRGTRKGLKINEYGVFKNDRRVAGRTEKEVYRQVGLPYIEPELRENRGEIEAAGKNRLPELVTLDDIRGDLHCHTRATDGHNSLEEMAQAARAKGYEYLAISDHSKHLSVARGLNKKRLLAEIARIDRLNEELGDIIILKAIEVDILEDGTLDLPDDILQQLDLVVGAVHYRFDLSRRRQTERILRAMENPCFNILAHPTGRLINSRPAYEVDLERIITAARENGCYLEVNAQPVRLDLTDTWCKLAKETGVRVAISTDAHSTGGLDYMGFGVDQARRGWLEAGDVLNTRKLDDLRKLLKR